jgi:hypothetical protein
VNVFQGAPATLSLGSVPAHDELYPAVFSLRQVFAAVYGFSLVQGNDAGNNEEFVPPFEEALFQCRTRSGATPLLVFRGMPGFAADAPGLKLFPVRSSKLSYDPKQWILDVKIVSRLAFAHFYQ